MFDHIIGNQKAKDYLTHTVKRERAGNSLLFAGQDGIGKSLFAESFAKLLICQIDPHGSHQRKIGSGNHPDIRTYRPEGKIGMHSIASMRQFNEEVYLKPFEAKWKIFILHEADRMLPQSANALLKTFEEPPQDAVIVLISSKPSALLPTVVSRSRLIFFQPLAEQEIASFIVNRFDKTFEDADLIAYMAQGSIGQAVRLVNEGASPVRTMLLDMLVKGKLTYYKQVMEISSEIAEHIEAEKKQVETEARKTLFGGMEDLSSLQKQSFEKEVDGVVALHGMQEAYALFEIILSWYRDLHLISLRGNVSYLMHRDYREACCLVAGQGNIIPMDDVLKAIADARLALERSTSLQICLENLFLKLNILA